MIETSVGRGAIWSALLQTGTSHHAPVFLSLDIRGPNDLVARTEEVLAKGIRKTELEAILAALTPPTPVAVAGRADHPTLVLHEGESFFDIGTSSSSTQPEEASFRRPGP